MFAVEGLRSGYGLLPVLQGIDLTSRPAKSSRCSAATAPARRRSCARSPAALPVTAGRIALEG